MQAIKKVIHRKSTSSGSGASDVDMTKSPATDNTSLPSETGGEDYKGYMHENHKDPNELDLSKGKVTQTKAVLAEQVARKHHVHNVEEVTRQKHLEKHQHHIQVAYQPVKAEDHAAEQVHDKVHPITRVHEKHASNEKDAALLANVAQGHGHVSGITHAPVQHQVVDKGEVVDAEIHHHIHNVVIPLVEHDTHEHHRIRTVIPIHEVHHEAPIIHEATKLEPISREEAQTLGHLGSKLSEVTNANVLPTGKCERRVEGVAETLAKELNLHRSASPALRV